MVNQQRHIIFSGSVQGVGFRFTACRVAGRYGVTGYVRNTADGRVECVVEGEQSQVSAFLAELAEAMAGYVIDTEHRTGPYTGSYSSFTVRY